MTIREVIERHGHFAHGGNPDNTAETWIESGNRAGAGDYVDTVGFKVSTGDLEVEEARELLGVG